MKDPSIRYHGTVQLISNADSLHTLEAGRDSMVR